MLPRKYRLRNTKNFDRVKSEGKVIQSKNFGLAVFKRKDKESSKFGFVVSTKISKKAVDRNKTKRRLREEVRKNLDKIKSGHDVVFLAKGRILDEDKEELAKEVLMAFKKVEII